MSTTNKDDFSPSDDSRNDSVTDDNHTEAIIDHQPPHLTRRSKFHRVQTGPTPNGTGLFAAASFKTDTAIGHITGTIQPPGYRSEYCMGFRDGALEPDAPYRYLNHSCDPNCELIEWEILNEETGESIFELWLHTVHPVRRGEELTIDYGWDHQAAIPCHCGSPNCRGWICALNELNQCRRECGYGSLAGNNTD